MKLQALILSFFILFPLKSSASHAPWVRPINAIEKATTVETSNSCVLKPANQGFLKSVFKASLIPAIAIGVMIGNALPANADSLVIDVSERKAYLYSDSGVNTGVYPVATPLPGKYVAYGTHYVHDKQVWPDWYPPASYIRRGYARVYRGRPGAPSALGERWMRLTGNIGMHGTNKQYSVGTQATGGCYRFKTADIIHLYNRLGNGDAVTIRR